MSTNSFRRDCSTTVLSTRRQNKNPDLQQQTCVPYSKTHNDIYPSRTSSGVGGAAVIWNGAFVYKGKTQGREQGKILGNSSEIADTRNVFLEIWKEKGPFSSSGGLMVRGGIKAFLCSATPAKRSNIGQQVLGRLA
ncbi:hypothetical protein JTE90_026134 [Oedothorax gibbosus]|uniref:Uncharacterized protein n=1 Tax=Oedothorax gibbosus TaxID=931172 RepID=A0AAV6V156_9ARAC|nr:hypothetical protein JTE90_026134 [Oedothorax gibbosus]